METAELEALKVNFERALEGWIHSIERLQEVLAESSYSVRSEDVWRKADFEQDEAATAVKRARESYEEALRKANFEF